MVKEYKFKFTTRIPKKKVKIKKLTPRRGYLYHYKIIKEDYSDKYLIDCGFRIFREVDYKPKEVGKSAVQNK